MTSSTGSPPSERTSTSGLSCEVLTTHSPALSSVDRLFGSGINATIFHHPRFLSYHSADKFPHAEWRHYLFSLKGNPVAFLPGAAVNEEQLTYRSPLGSTHGGLVHAAFSFAKLDECLNLWWEDIQQQGFERAEIVLPPLPYSEPNFSEAVELKLNHLGFVLHEPLLCPIVPITPGPDFPRHLLRTTAWQKCKQARARGVTVRYSTEVAADLELFYPILVENRRRFGVVPTHSLEELLRIHGLCPDALHLFLATAHGQPVAGILVFQATPLVVNTFYIADVESGRDARAVDLLLLETYKWALERSVRWVDLGPSSYRLEVNWTLTHFKEGHGGRTFLRRPYVWHR
jgi:hypothetical protein